MGVWTPLFKSVPQLSAETPESIKRRCFLFELMLMLCPYNHPHAHATWWDSRHPRADRRVRQERDGRRAAVNSVPSVAYRVYSRTMVVVESKCEG